MLFPELHRAGFLFLGSLITSAVDIIRFIFAACRSCCLCDVNHDESIDMSDIQLITAARNTPASGPSDPRDFDGDGTITVNDARGCVLQCTNARCAP